MKKWMAWLLAAIIPLSFGCTTTSGMQNIHHSLADSSSTWSGKLLQLPVKVTVNEISAGGVTEPVPQWSETATHAVTAAVAQVLASDADSEFVSLPTLSADEQSLVDEHLALYEAVAYSAYQHAGAMGSNYAWPQKLARFDYTIGPALKFLKDKTGADAALIVVGEDNVSSAGRKAAYVVAALFGVALQVGYCGLTAGVVDLESGNVLWLDFALNQATVDLRTRDGSKELVDAVFRNFPGRDSAAKASGR